MKAWLVRAGRSGEREDFNLTEGLVGGGWKEVPDLSSVTSREALEDLVREIYGESVGLVRNYTAQLWALRNRISEGDLAVMPLKESPQVAIGRVIGGYEYRDDPDPTRRHAHRVQWLATDVPRAAIKQDLLHSLGAFMTICELSRNDAVARLVKLAETGMDPGATAPMPEHEDAGAAGTDVALDAEAASSFDIAALARDRLTQVIAERFAGHGLEHLVAQVLTAMGYTCDVVPPGPDGGIDIFAGGGPLGLDPPRLVVQVKSGAKPVDAMTVRQLHGVIATHGADQGLFVAWAGLSAAARAELRTQRLNVRVWNADDFIDALCSVYDSLPREVQAQLPLKAIWVLADDEEGS